MDKPQGHRWLPALSLSILAAAALYLAVIVGSDAQAVAAAARRIGAGVWAAILALSVLNYGLRFLRWELYLRHLGHGLPRARHAAIYTAGFALTTTPGKAGEAIRSLYLHAHRVPYAQSLAALFAERLLDLLAMLLLALLGALALGWGRGWVVAGALPLAVVVIVLRSPGFRRGLSALALPARLARWRERFMRLFDASAALLSPKLLLLALALGVVSWGAEGVGLYLVTQVLAPEVTLGLAIGIYALAMLGGAASFMPGGLGGAEAVMGALLVLAGAPLPEAVAATLICRAATLWFAILLGLIAMGVLQMGRQWGRQPQ